jgi:thymidine kinase
MAKLFFRYGSMSSCKSAHLLLTNFNYNERGKKTLLFTSAKDDRYGKNMIKSRVGLQAEAIGINDNDDLFEITKKQENISCVLIDEAQFLKKEHIYQLTDIVDKLNIPVIAYGIRNDFQLNTFEGSSYLLALADNIEELKTLCYKCDKKAILNIRYRGNLDIVTQGNQVEIGGNDTYIPLCRKCYKELIERNYAQER